MTDPAGPRVELDADLQLSIDGVGATLVGRSGEVVLRTDEPARLSRALRSGGVLPALRRLDQRLTAAGLELPTLTVEGPRGRIASLPLRPGDARATTSARRRVQWHRPQDLLPTWWRRALLGALAAVVVIVWRRRR